MSRVKPIDLCEAMDENMMLYAAYIITERVCPRIEDGYKSVHRRIVWSMFKMNATKFTKNKQIDGEVVGKYHPHGGAYGAMVNMITKNYQNIQPLIGKGNFGSANSKKDEASADRYTESKLSPMIIDMLEGLKNDEVDYGWNFDGTLQIPDFIPFKYPNVLTIYNKGIAVGMASTILSYNLKDVCNATIKYLKTGEHTTMIPDFGTKGYIVRNDEELENIAKTGKGTVYLKSKVEIDEKNRTIIVREIPYSTTVEQISEKIAEGITNGNLPEVSDYDDITDNKGFRLEIYYKRGTDVNKLLNKLYSTTPMFDSISANMNILVDGKPLLLGTNDVIRIWCEKRKESIYRRLKFLIEKLDIKLNKLYGLEKVLLDIDKAIEIIRRSKDINADLMKAFDLNEEQAIYVRKMRLEQINEEYIIEQIQEIRELEGKLKDYKSKQNDEGVSNIICEELEYCIKEYGIERNTEVIDYEEKNKIAKAVKKIEESKKYRVILTKENYIKKTAQNGDIKLKDGDKIIDEVVGDANTEIACFLNDGNCRKIRVKDIKESTANTLGDYLPVLLELKDEKIVKSLILNDNTGGFIVAIFGNNKINKIDINNYKINRRLIERAYNNDNGLIYLNYFKKDANIKIEGAKKSVVVDTSQLKAKGRTAVGIQTIPKTDKITKLAIALK